MALGLNSPAQTLELTKPSVAQSQARKAPARLHNPVDAVEARDAVTANPLSSGS